MMKKIVVILTAALMISCNRNQPGTGKPIITVSIAPYKYFVEQIAGSDFSVNVMVPGGSNPHIYEPYPLQVADLRRSVAYVSNGFLGFEETWLDRFYEMNKTMVRLSLGDNINPIASEHKHGEGGHIEGADPHYWVSPKAALKLAVPIEELLVSLNPGAEEKYRENLAVLVEKISRADKKATELFSTMQNRAFMIYHPNLAYIARDYGIREISVEFEGKEPSPLRLKQLIDLAKTENIKTIFVQKEYDAKNARAIASEINSKVAIIDPLSEDWEKSVNDIITAVYDSFVEAGK